jgi:predicted phosphoadenosine phosphosulfate sulfurtransferase
MNTRQIVRDYERTWEGRCYFNGIPDESPDEIRDKVPSYKRIAIALLNNDMQLMELGYEPKKSKYYSMLKRIELKDKLKTNQLKLEL